MRRRKWRRSYASCDESFVQAHSVCYAFAHRRCAASDGVNIISKNIACGVSAYQGIQYLQGLVMMCRVFEVFATQKICNERAINESAGSMLMRMWNFRCPALELNFELGIT